MGFLLDIGHLKVSSKTLKKNFYEELRKTVKISDALHLSDNDGISDLNHPLKTNSKIWNIIKKNITLLPLKFIKKPTSIKKTIKIGK